MHPWVDLLLHGEVTLGHPAQVDRLIVGGGGGLAGRLGLVRGRTSLAVTARLGATAYGEGGGAAALVDIVSPGIDLSFRVTGRAALHTGLRVVLGYVTEPAAFVGGFEGRFGLTIGLTDSLALLGSIASGATLWGAQGPATARLEVMVGLEVRLGASPRADRDGSAEIQRSEPSS